MKTLRTRHTAGALTSMLLACLAAAFVATPARAQEGPGPSLGDLTAQSPQSTGPGGGAGQPNAQGDFTYSYPIEVPPGRRGHQPHVSLGYSSAGSVHGGVAAGWTLPVPAITVDPEAGTLRPQWPTGGSAAQPRNFLGPDGSPLLKDSSLPVGAGGTGYRSATDAAFTRFEFLGAVASAAHWWVAHTRDGMKSYFGLKSQTPYSYAPLASQVDHTGHEIRYGYAVVGRVSDATPAAGQPRELLLQDIHYLAPGGESYARVTFHHDGPAFCGTPEKLPAVGGRLDYRLGFAMLSGTRKLTAVKTWRKQASAFQPVRQYDLSYTGTEVCATAAVTPYRELASIQQTAYSPTIPSGSPGGTTVLPKTEFTYGKAVSYVHGTDYESEVPLPNLVLPSSIETNDHVVPQDEPCAAPFCPSASTSARALAQRQFRGESVQAMWLDVNGDGLPDQLRVPARTTLSASAPATGNCKVETWINRGALGFAKDHQFSFSLRDAFADIPVQAPAGSTGAGELICSLSRSFSATHAGGYGDPGRACMYPAQWGSLQRVDHAFADMDGDRLPDLVSRPIASFFCPYASTHGKPVHRLSGAWPTLNTADWVSHESTLAEQKYWYVYRNTGAGFAATPTLVRSVVPDDQPGAGDWKVRSLPSPSISGMRHRAWICGENRYHGMYGDLTGDGKLDVGDGFCHASAPALFVGKPSGEIDWSQSYQLPTGVAPAPGTKCVSPCDTSATPFRHNGIVADVNGDGLTDLLQETDTGTRVRFHTGYGWGGESDGHAMMFSEGAAETKHPVLTKAVENLDDRQMPASATVYARSQFIDLDYDGLADALYRHHETGVDYTRLYLNGGGAWVKSVDATYNQDGLFRASLGATLVGLGVTSEHGESGDYLWKMTYQSLDVNGDGLLDLVRPSANGVPHVRYAKAVIDTSADRKAPSRLLRTVRNGSGATTTVGYERQPAAARWAVSEVTTSPGASQPDIIERYAYQAGARFTANPYGVSVFRGFGEVRKLAVGNPADAADDLTAVQLYSYQDDFRGVLTRTATVLGSSAFTAEGAFSPATQNGVMSLEDRSYEFHTMATPLAPGMAAIFQPKVTLPTGGTNYTCTGHGGQTANNCVEAGLSLRESASWQALSRNGSVAVKVPSSVRKTFTNADGVTEERVTDYTYQLAWSATGYHLAPQTTARSVRLAGVSTVLGQVAHTYADAGFFYPATSTVHDPVQGQAVTRFAFHTSGVQTGQLRYLWQPEQIRRYGSDAAPSRATQLAYDSFGVHVTKTVNPAGHTQLFTTDLGTGAVLAVHGPGYVCPDDADADAHPQPPTACTLEGTTLREGLAITVDGLARPISTVAHSIGSASTEIERRSYQDGANPVSETVQSRNGDNNFGSVTSYRDGLGRVVRTDTSQAPQPTRTVSYTYDQRGFAKDTIAARGDGQGQIGVRRHYDPLGRVVNVSEILSGSHLLEMHTYAGLTHTFLQMPQGDASREAEKRSTFDPAGQLVQVREKSGYREEDGDTVPSYAYTDYRYDGLGRMRSMRDPDGVLTTAVHDYQGHRRNVSSAGRTWSYTYDGNGNLTAVVEPVPAGVSSSDYTHLMAYDDLNRLVSSTPPVRDLTVAERAELKHGVTHYLYDTAHPSAAGGVEHLIGRLAAVSSPVATVVNEYDSYGQLRRSTQDLTALDGIVDADDLRYTTNREAGTNRVENTALEARNATAVTFAGPALYYSHDADGTQRAVQVGLGGNSYLTLAEQTRNAAGVVTIREANGGSIAGYAKPVVNYGHDRFGRMVSMQATSGGTQLYKLTQSYWDNEEVKQTQTVHGPVGTPASTMDYQYDHRMQLTAATETGGVGYRGVFGYTNGGRVASAAVSATGAARVPSREVTHVYDSTDPQRLAALRKPDQSDLATFGYDLAGHVTARALPDGTAVTQRWDGENLRKVSTPNGAEVSFYLGGTRVAAVRYTAAGTLLEARRWFGDAEVVYAPGQAPLYRRHVRLAGETVGRVDGPAGAPVIEHYLTDPRGNPVLALAATDAAVKRRAGFGPFGELLTEWRAGGTPAGKYGKEFNGKDYDPLAGLLYYGARHYDPLALQWTSADPKYRLAFDADPAHPRRANLYTFSLNNPVGLIDTDGFDGRRSGKDSIKITGPDIRSGPKGSVESDGRAEVRLFEGELSKMDILDGFLVLKIAPTELGLSIQAGALLPFLKAAGLSAELRAPIQITDDVAMLLYGKAKMLGANVSGNPNVYLFDGQAGLGWRDEHGDKIGYVGGQFLGTRPIYFGFQVDGFKLDVDPGSSVFTPAGEAVGDAAFWLLNPTRPGGDGWGDNLSRWYGDLYSEGGLMSWTWDPYLFSDQDWF